MIIHTLNVRNNVYSPYFGSRRNIYKQIKGKIVIILCTPDVYFEFYEDTQGL